MRLPDYVLSMISVYKAAGYTAVVTGGCVRDFLLGIEPTDYDISVNAPPSVTKELFGAENVTDTGLKHGTVTVNAYGHRVEVTVFRKESSYSDNRHPDSVCFEDTFANDASRRDFTVNAMCYSPEGGITDLFGGRKDIENRLIRAVGDPEKRFREDGLRIMRALRFASVLGFEIESGTKKALHGCKGLLLNISPERLFSELLKLLCGAHVEMIITEYTDVLGVFLPCLLPMKNFSQNNPYHIYDVLTHTAKVTGAIPPEPVLRLAALFHDTGKPLCYTEDSRGGHFYGHAELSATIADNSLRELKAPTALREQTVQLVRQHDTVLETGEAFIRRRLNRLGYETFLRLIALQRADNSAKSPHIASRNGIFDKAEETANDIIKASRCFSLKNLAVNGTDLAAIGIPQSKATGIILRQLLDEVIDGKCENKKDVLLVRAEALKTEMR